MIYTIAFRKPNGFTATLFNVSRRNGVLEYWGAEEYGRPPAGSVSFKFKMDTDLYDLAKAKTRPCSISFSLDGKNMAVTARDKQVCACNQLLPGVFRGLLRRTVLSGAFWHPSCAGVGLMFLRLSPESCFVGGDITFQLGSHCRGVFV